MEKLFFYIDPVGYRTRDLDGDTLKTRVWYDHGGRRIIHDLEIIKKNE